MNKKLTITCEEDNKKSSYVIEKDQEGSNLLLVSEAVTKLYEVLAIECDVPSILIDEFFREITKPFTVEELGIEPQFENVDDFTTKFNEDKEFRNFLFDLFKESFCEKV